MEDDGFTLVTGRKAGKQSAKFKKTENGKHIRVDGTLESIEKAMELAKNGILKSGLGTWLHHKLQLLISPHQKIQTIYVIGNGHFDGSTEPGAHQLALFLEISEQFQCPIIFQEPVCSATELKWLESKNVEIRREMDAKIDICEEKSISSMLSIFAFIHGEHEIFNEFLEFNAGKIDNLIVIGNDYGGANWELSKNREKMPKITEFCEKSIITAFPAIYEPNSNAFSSTVIMSSCDNQ
ncbi:SRR1-like domain-containing protein [Caenorhabditis elegans]|uniref:SRR1-like domain-containing protein n=1 Tax=Caenorhabditis elegans TaxID=6239 RepID=C0VXV7_CAEEL|nr:SRR1-like domain-containing protein [Caenorhabditis elegans]CCD71955.1 SRR1-like domain-containing protein [Caenorhabditis elegans]|eukprot:NP_001255226.1 Uncharacterized protein CELE_Y55F3BL.4 [Caenorhabditis elegans]